MDLYDLYENPQCKMRYVICLNWSISNISQIYCFCEKHHVFVSRKQTKRRHCKQNCVYKTEITEENKTKLIERTQPLIEKKVKEFRPFYN